MQKSFTLIEILVTVTILGLITAIIAQNYIQLSKNARDTKIKASIESLRDALEIYKTGTVNNSYPLTLQSLVTENIIKTVPPSITYGPLTSSGVICTLPPCPTYTLIADLEDDTAPYIVGPNMGK